LLVTRTVCCRCCWLAAYIFITFFSLQLQYIRDYSISYSL
jgi:hypothetical protein